MHPPIKENTPEYRRAHKILKRDRGPARDYTEECEMECGKKPQQWAWIHGQDPWDIWSYRALCISCHHKYDGINAGEGNPHAKLTAEDVAEIRARWPDWKDSGLTQKQIAGIYGVHLNSISNLLRGVTW